MKCDNQKISSIDECINSYQKSLEEKVKREEEIKQLKKQIAVLKDDQKYFTMQMENSAREMQIEVYRTYTKKDLLKMAAYIEKYEQKTVLEDFKTLIEKFEIHDLGINDITNLQTYFKIHGKYARKENTILRNLFKAFGGNLDD